MKGFFFRIYIKGGLWFFFAAHSAQKQIMNYNLVFAGQLFIVQPTAATPTTAPTTIVPFGPIMINPNLAVVYTYGQTMLLIENHILDACQCGIRHFIYRRQLHSIGNNEWEHFCMRENNQMAVTHIRHSLFNNQVRREYWQRIRFHLHKGDHVVGNGRRLELEKVYMVPGRRGGFEILKVTVKTITFYYHSPSHRFEACYTFDCFKWFTHPITREADWVEIF